MSVIDLNLELSRARDDREVVWGRRETSATVRRVEASTRGKKEEKDPPTFTETNKKRIKIISKRLNIKEKWSFFYQMSFG
jgi:hypothetical protein